MKICKDGRIWGQNNKEAGTHLGEELNVSTFPSRDKDYLKRWRHQYYLEHREELLKINKEWRIQNPERHRQNGRKQRLNLKTQVVSYYGNGKPVCVKCGFTDIRALSIDHIDGNGSNHRVSIGIQGGNSFYKWLKRNNYPEGYQTLCMNCQLIKSFENKECRRCAQMENSLMNNLNSKNALKI